MERYINVISDAGGHVCVLEVKAEGSNSAKIQHRQIKPVIQEIRCFWTRLSA